MSWRLWGVPRQRALFVIVIIALIIGPATAAADYKSTVDLGKDYTYKQATARYVKAVDVMNLTYATVEFLSTAGDDSDLKSINTPTVRYIHRHFSSKTGDFKDLNLTIETSDLSTVNWEALPTWKVYTEMTIPTVRVTAQGATGNPMVTRYNNSWDKGDTDTLDTLFRSAQVGYLYTNKNGEKGLLAINASTNTYTIAGSMQSSDYDTSDYSYTLNHNVVDLDSYESDPANARNMGNAYSDTLPSAGKYTFTAINHTQSEKQIGVYAFWPCVILDGNTRITWDGSTTPGSYYTTTGGDVNLSFDAPPASMENITYFMIQKDPSYDIDMYIDTDQLAQNAEARWDGWAATAHIVDLLQYAVIRDVFSTPLAFNYTVTPVGAVAGENTSGWSDIAITSGYGISGHIKAKNITIQESALDSLNPGDYYIYAMGLDGDHNVVALDQSEVTLGVAPPERVPVANFTATPETGDAPLTVQFTDTSENNPTSWSWTFGDGGTSTARNASHVYTTAGTYTVNLTVRNVYGSDYELKPAHISVLREDVVEVEGANTTIQGGNVNVSINLTASGATVSGNTITIPNPGQGFTSMVVTTTNTSQSGNTVNGTVTNVQANTEDVNATVDDEVGDVSTNLQVNLKNITQGGKIKTGITKGNASITNNISSYFSLQNKNTKVGYSLTIEKDNIIATNVTSAYINMSIRHSWVENNGGRDAIVITRTTEDGTEELDTEFLFYSDPKDYFRAFSPNGLSVFSLVAATVTPSPTPGPAPAPSGPDAYFIVNATSGQTPLPVMFTDMSSGSPTSWYWTFGDGNTSSEQSPVHVYEVAGVYSVTLRASNTYGSDSYTRSDVITARSGEGPVANFAASVTEGAAPLAVQFTDQSVGDPTAWNWSFGDGETSTEQNPSHVYSSPGVYSVTLTVSNAYGSNSMTRTDYITANAGPLASITVSPSTRYLQSSETADLTATGYDASGYPVTLITAGWSSSNPAAVTVTGSGGSGTVTGVAAGNATISVTQDEVTGTAAVAVYSKITDAYTDPVTGEITKQLAVDAVDDYLYNDRISKLDAVRVVYKYLYGEDYPE
ncbi:MAG: PKD domain-containing protein [Methanomicrobiales archaeon]